MRRSFVLHAICNLKGPAGCDRKMMGDMKSD